MGLFDLFSNDSAEKAASDRNAGLQTGYDQQAGLQQQGRDALQINYDKASGLYAPLIASSGAGATAYGDATGANGAAGLEKATNNFKSSTQYGNYGFALDNGLQALQRTHAAAGNLNSGNADTDTLNFATNLAGGQYSNYVAGLAPYLNQQSGAVAGAAGVDTGLGTALNSSLTTQGQAANTAQTGMGASTAAADMNNYNVGANQFNAVMGAGKLAANLFGGFG